MACIWYGVQAWIGGNCVVLMIRAIWPSFNNLHNTMVLGPTRETLWDSSFSGLALFLQFGAFDCVPAGLPYAILLHISSNHFAGSQYKPSATYLQQRQSSFPLLESHSSDGLSEELMESAPLSINLQLLPDRPWPGAGWQAL
jgi:hypothetical protein